MLTFLVGTWIVLNFVCWSPTRLWPDATSAEHCKLSCLGLSILTIFQLLLSAQKFKKNVVFKFGSRPFTSVVCAGLEEGLLGMRVGGRRQITVPVELGPANLKLPPGIPLVYDVTLTEVFQNYL